MEIAANLPPMADGHQRRPKTADRSRPAKCLNPDSHFRSIPIRKRYHYTQCQGHLHPFTLVTEELRSKGIVPCSEDNGEDGAICCPAGIGCIRKRRLNNRLSLRKRKQRPTVTPSVRRTHHLLASKHHLQPPAVRHWYHCQSQSGLPYGSPFQVAGFV